MNRRWICTDIWMDMFPHFDRPQLGLKFALLSDRFEVLVDKHFDGKSELTIWREITIQKDTDAEMPTMSVFIDHANSIEFPLPYRPLSNKIRFKDLQIRYIDHFVLTFLRANKQIWDKGIILDLNVTRYQENVQPIWDVLAREIWPIFAPNIRCLFFFVTDLHNLRRRTSPTILTDLKQLNSIYSWDLFPDAICDDGPNATAGQALSKWLHTPTKDGKPKQLHCFGFHDPTINIDEWINNFKEVAPIFFRYIDHSVIKFIRDNQQIWYRGTNLRLDVPSTKYVQPIWNVFAHEIWPIFAPNICHLSFFDGRHLNNLRLHTSPSILTDLDIISIHSNYLLPASIADDGPKSKAAQALSKWLHTPRNDGQPKRLGTQPFTSKKAAKLVNNLKEAFLRATNSSASYVIRIQYFEPTEIVPFELMNEQTNEKLTLEKKGDNGSANDHLVLKRCQIGRTIQWEDGNPSILNNIDFWIDSDSGTNCIGHCSTKDGPIMAKKKK